MIYKININLKSNINNAMHIYVIREPEKPISVNE